MSETISISAYLTNMGWKANDWTILKQEEWTPLTNIKGYENKIYDFIKDPVGKEQFGKTSRVVNLDFWNEHKGTLAAQPEIEAVEKPASSIPPPPTKEEKVSSIPTPPSKETPQQPEKTPDIDKKANPNASLRIAQLLSLGWIEKEDGTLISKHGTEKTSDEIANLDDVAFFSLLSEVAPTQEPVVETKAEPTAIEKMDIRFAARIKNLKFTGFEIVEAEKLVTVLNRAYTFDQIRFMMEPDFSHLLREKMTVEESKEAAAAVPEKSKDLIIEERIELFEKANYKVNREKKEISFGGVSTTFSDLGDMEEEAFQKFFAECKEKFEPNYFPKTSEELAAEAKLEKEREEFRVVIKSRKIELRDLGLEEMSSGSWKYESGENTFKVLNSIIHEKDQKKWDKKIISVKKKLEKIGAIEEEEKRQADLDAGFDEKADSEIAKASADLDSKRTAKERIKARILFFDKKGFNVDENSEEPILVLGDGEESISVREIEHATEEEWMAITARFTPKAMKDRADKAKVIAEPLKQAEGFTEAEKEEALKGTDKENLTVGATGGLFSALAKVGFGQPKLSLDLLKNGKYKVSITIDQEEIDVDLAFKLMKDISEFKKKK